MSDGRKPQRFTSSKRSPRGGVKGIETVQAPQGQAICPSETREVPKESILQGLSPAIYPVTIGRPTIEYWPCSELGKKSPSTASGARTPEPIVHLKTPARSPRRARQYDTSFTPIEPKTTEQSPENPRPKSEKSMLKSGANSGPDLQVKKRFEMSPACWVRRPCRRTSLL